MALCTGHSPSYPSWCKEEFQASPLPEDSEILRCTGLGGFHHHGWRRKALRVLRRSRATFRLLKTGFCGKAHPRLSDSSIQPSLMELQCEAGARRREAYLFRLGIPVAHGLPAGPPPSHRGVRSERSSKSGGTLPTSINKQVSDAWSSDESEVFQLDNQVDASTDATDAPSSSTDSSNTDNEEERETELQVLARGDFRLSYLRRLSYEQVWVPRPHRPKQHSAVIVLDWDDTLLCTTFLSHSRMTSGNRTSMGDRLRSVALAAQQLLELSLSLGETIIVTNAWTAWVDHSAKKYVPSLLPLLEEIEVISARQRYEAQFPQQIAEWKMNVFLELQRRRNPESITNLIAIGDSCFEIDAAIAIGQLFPRAIVKTVKFREAPTPEELVKELQLAGDRLRKIVESGKSLQVAMERRPTNA